MFRQLAGMSVFEFLTQTLIGRTYCSSYESTGSLTLTTNQKGLASQCILLLIL